MITHMQTYYCHTSLGTQLEIQVSSWIVEAKWEKFALNIYFHKAAGSHRHVDETWQASTKYLDRVADLTNDNTGAHLWAFITGTPDPKGFAGWAPVGVLCASNEKWRRSINANYGSPAGLAHIVAHETGHNLGMSHDFVKTNVPRYFKGESCNGKGIMSYGSPPKEWSKCSRNDFLARYNKYKDNWCLQSKYLIFQFCKLHFDGMIFFMVKINILIHCRERQRQLLWWYNCPLRKQVCQWHWLR